MKLGKPNAMIDSVTSGLTKALRTVKLIGDDRPEGLPWKNKVTLRPYSDISRTVSIQGSGQLIPRPRSDAVHGLITVLFFAINLPFKQNAAARKEQLGRKTLQTDHASHIKNVFRMVNMACEIAIHVQPSRRPYAPAQSTPLLQDPRKDYRFGTELGHGNYGVVHSITHIRTGKVFACKILRDDASAQQRKHLLAEVSALFRVRKHPNIVTLHEARIRYCQQSTRLTAPGK